MELRKARSMVELIKTMVQVLKTEKKTWMEKEAKSPKTKVYISIGLLLLPVKL